VYGPATEDPAEAMLVAEQYFIRSLGGFVLGIAGAELVTNERLPLPRFNYVQVHQVAPERRTAFFERALDHYFQRALRPTFRVSEPVPPHVDASLRSLGFRQQSARLSLRSPAESLPSPSVSPFDVRPARETEFDAFLSLWTGERDRPELRSAIDVVWHHPNPDERLTPVVASQEGRVVSAGLLYEHLGVAGLHFIATRPGERGQGAASALVTGVFGSKGPGALPRGFLFADSPRLNARLATLGFGLLREFVIYELPPEAELALPSVGPPSPPRWRPPRGSGSAGPPPSPGGGLSSLAEMNRPPASPGA